MPQSPSEAAPAGSPLTLFLLRPGAMPPPCLTPPLPAADAGVRHALLSRGFQNTNSLLSLLPVWPPTLLQVPLSFLLKQCLKQIVSEYTRRRLFRKKKQNKN